MKILTDPRSGSYQGITSSRNRFGQYVRTRATPVQPRTPKQTNNRGFLTQGSSAWRTLSDADRTAWNDYADQISRSDSLGSSYHPTGASLYSGATVMLGTAPAGPPPDLPSYVLTVDNITYTDPTPGPEAFTLAVLTTSADNVMIIETSGKVSPGLTSAAAVRRWFTLPQAASNRFIQQFPFATNPVAFLTNYNYLFPSPQTGDVIWFRFREIAYPGGSAIPITNKLFQTLRFVTP